MNAGRRDAEFAATSAEVYRVTWDDRACHTIADYYVFAQPRANRIRRRSV